MKRYFLLLLCSIVTISKAQEFLLPLNYNGALFNQNHSDQSLMRIAAIDDTLLPPFIDDFSRLGMYPFDSLWLDSGAYINNNYTERPITLGIATLDGIDKNGRPYHEGATSDSVADMLTSRPIDLTVPAGDTSTWISFFYQPQGLGDVPETKDSLVLQFFNHQGQWTNVWAVPGRSDTAWQRVNIRITDTTYLYRGFQFRFYNIATVNGNRDQWNLDYVTLLKNTVANASIVDLTLIHPQTSLLTEFSAMPYPHYKSLSNPASAMKINLPDTVFNIDFPGTSFTPGLNILHNGLSVFPPPVMGNITAPNTQQLYPYTLPLSGFTYPIYPEDTADFLVKSYTSQAGTNLYNDTSYYTQHFGNYYSYDDGSAEAHYALSGSNDVSLAVKFDVKMQDTLRGMQIYFNPSGENIANKLFQMTVWSDIDLSTQASTELVREINLKPDTFDGINAFKTYLFSSNVVVGPGPIWIGLIQNDPQQLFGIGFDRNTDSHDKVAVRYAGSWVQSNIPGSIMIRPLFGKRIPGVGVGEIVGNEIPFSVYPNPSTGNFYISIPSGSQYSCNIFGAVGNLVHHENLKQSVWLNENLSAGIYFVKLTDSKTGLSSVQKLLIN